MKEEWEDQIKWSEVAKQLPEIFKKREEALKKFRAYDSLIQAFPKHLDELEGEED